MQTILIVKLNKMEEVFDICCNENNKKVWLTLLRVCRLSRSQSTDLNS